MGTSFVHISGNGFWMHDSVLELFLRLAALHIEDQVDEGSPAHAIRDQWLLASRGYFTGAVALDLESDVRTTEGRQVVVAAIQSLLEALGKGPSLIDSSGLNVLGISGDFVSGFETARLVEVGKAFLALIDGAAFGGPQSTAFMPGCGAD